MITLTGNNLTLTTLKKILYTNETVQPSKESLTKVKNSRKAVEEIVNQGKTVYGINTGFGKLSDVRIDKEDVETLQLN